MQVYFLTLLVCLRLAKRLVRPACRVRRHRPPTRRATAGSIAMESRDGRRQKQKAPKSENKRNISAL